MTAAPDVGLVVDFVGGRDHSLDRRGRVGGWDGFAVDQGRAAVGGGAEAGLRAGSQPAPHGTFGAQPGEADSPAALAALGAAMHAAAAKAVRKAEGRRDAMPKGYGTRLSVDDDPPRSL